MEDYLYTLNHTVDATTPLYGATYQELCTNIMQYAGDNLSSETEGLDVYIHTFNVNTANATGTALVPGENFDNGGGDKITIVFGFKKKSSPVCS